MRDEIMRLSWKCMYFLHFVLMVVDECKHWVRGLEHPCFCKIHDVFLRMQGSSLIHLSFSFPVLFVEFK